MLFVYFSLNIFFQGKQFILHRCFLFYNNSFNFLCFCEIGLQHFFIILQLFILLINFSQFVIQLFVNLIQLLIDVIMLLIFSNLSLKLLVFNLKLFAKPVYLVFSVEILQFVLGNLFVELLLYLFILFNLLWKLFYLLFVLKLSFVVRLLDLLDLTV